MAWAIPQYSKKKVDWAGSVLIDESIEAWDDEFTEAIAVISNWRSSHSFPLNTFQSTLRKKARQIDADSLVAQRIKRLSSIRHKLERFQRMKLSQVQDIGGCRAVMSNVEDVEKLVEIYKKSDIKHKLIHEDNYIADPKSSGYRGVHLIYRYYSDKKDTYNILRIEMQLRSALQHAWATAVETVGTFIRQALKSSIGEEDWLKFFALMGTAIAIRERRPAVPDTPTDNKQLKHDLRLLAKTLDVEGHLHAYGSALQTLEQPGAKHAHYYLVRLDPVAKQVRITGYTAGELEKASQEYLRVEQDRLFPSDAVLVSVDSMAALRRAYPNYFLDTHLFLDAVNRAIE